jgi:hypothetical protein
MKPIEFKGVNTILAENQPQYLPLPVWKDEDGTVISCWQLNWRERLKLFIDGRIWVKVLTFNKPLQPQKLFVKGDLKNGSLKIA